MSFSDMRGQDNAISFLKSAMQSCKVSHAYIFAGSRGSGRSLLARNFAKALNCDDQKNPPCDSCPSCRKIDKDSHPDVTWIRKEKVDSDIKIDRLRELKSSVNLKAYEGKYKVYVIVDAQLMSPGASNSFLKTLEEPPANSMFILITDEPKRLLPTIISRCQTIRLNAVGSDSKMPILLDVLKEFSDDECIGDYSAGNREELSRKLSVLASWYRDLLVFRSTKNSDLLIHRDSAGRISESAENYKIDEIMNMFESVVSAKEKIEKKVNPKLALTAMLSKVR